MTRASVADLLADLLGSAERALPDTTPAKAANSANCEHPCGIELDSGAREGLRKAANSQPEPATLSQDSQKFAEIRSRQNHAQSKQPRGFSQDSQDSQGYLAGRAIRDPEAEREAGDDFRHPPMGAPSKPSKGGFDPFEGGRGRGYGEPSPPIGGAANDLLRTCRDCANSARYGNCRKPIEAGLLPTGSTFAILWAPEGHAATCPAFAAKASAKAPDRPYRLTPAEGDAAHAEPWDDVAIVRFVARVALLMRRGFDATDADDLAERLHLRDVQSDERVLCLECAHLAGHAAGRWRCGNACAAGVAPELPEALAMRLQRCPGFAP